MALTGQAHGKLLLFGEHAVVHGYPALGLTLPLSTCIRLKPCPHPSVSKNRDLIQRLVRHWKPAYRQPWLARHWDVTIESNIPIACGFGSSAALTGALARAFVPQFSPPAPADEKMTRILAHQAEFYFHGRPSGVDTALALTRGLSLFRLNPEGAPELTPLRGGSLTLVVGYVPREKDTKTLVMGIQQRMKSQRARTTRDLAELGTIAEQASRLLSPPLNHSIEQFSELATRAHALLRGLDLSTPLLDTIIRVGQKAGACGGKLSGAGGGGAFILFCRKTEEALRVQKTLIDRFPPLATCLQAYVWQANRLAAVPMTA